MKAQLREYVSKEIRKHLPHSHFDDIYQYHLSLEIAFSKPEDRETLRKEFDTILKKYNLL